MEKLHLVWQTCKSLADVTVFKIGGAIAATVLSFFFDPVQYQSLFILLVLITFDFITAIMAVRRDKTQVVESAKMVKTAIKMSLYFILISSGNLAEKALGFESNLPFGISLDGAILGYLIATELYSILENSGKSGFKVPQRILDVISTYIKKDEKVIERSSVMIVTEEKTTVPVKEETKK